MTFGLRGAGVFVVVVCLLGAVVQHKGLGFMGNGDGAGSLRPRLSVNLHRHAGTLQDQLRNHAQTKKEDTVSRRVKATRIVKTSSNVF